VFDHITIRAGDRKESELFYDTVLRTIGVAQTSRDETYTVWGGDFSLAHADDDNPVTRHLHIGFVAPSPDAVDEFWNAGTAAGYRDDGPPGPRPEYGSEYYGGFLLDPDGNSAEAMHLGDDGHTGSIDHLWIRVADLQASKRFYELVGPFGGFSLRREREERVQFTWPRAHSFSVVTSDTPTEHVHVAFEAGDNAAVDAFHRDLTAAGYPDYGPPGERAIYHPGYYGAFVLDPDGNNVEVVNHNR
jgi:catechol 2,3-dioxygenase-like lactoylglutathione lyase family enzyme